MVGTGQSVFMPAAEAATAVVSVGSAEWIRTQSGFQVSTVGRDPANYMSVGMGHIVPAPAVGTAGSMELVPAYAGPVRYVQCESKNYPPEVFWHFFPKRLGIFCQFFTHLLHVPLYARLQIFIQLPLTVTKFCHIKCDQPANIYISPEL